MMLHFDFSKLQEKDFKEDSVREFIIMPLLRLLGFDEKNLLTLDIEQECKECDSSRDALSPNLELLKQCLTTTLESLRQNLSGDSKRVKKPDSWYLERPLPEVITNPQKD